MVVMVVVVKVIVVMVIEDSGGGSGSDDDGDSGPESPPEGTLCPSMPLQFMKNWVTLAKFI